MEWPGQAWTGEGGRGKGGVSQMQMIRHKDEKTCRALVAQRWVRGGSWGNGLQAGARPCLIAVRLKLVV